MIAFALGLVDGCRLLDTGEGLRLEAPGGVALVLSTVEPGEEIEKTDGLERRLVERLMLGGAEEEELAALATELAGFGGTLGLYPLLFALHERSLLRREVRHGGELLLSAVALNPRCPFTIPENPVSARVAERCQVLSRFALLRRIGNVLALETPLGPWRVGVHGAEGMALLAALATPKPFAVLIEASGLDPTTLERSLGLLDSAALLSMVGEEHRPAEDGDPSLAAWQAHDLFFHARSRLGSHAGGYGGTFRGRRLGAPLPALRPPHEGPVVELYRPDLERLRRDDVPLTQVLEQRCSTRKLGEPPIDLRELGELLYRAARVTGRAMGEGYELAWRPFPGGGGAYELELYPMVERCQGLEPGLYHYRPDSHQLVRLAESSPEGEILLDHAALASRTRRPLQVLLLVAARFRRVSWKYESMAYATVLKDVGVLFQTFYLVATAMGLGICAVGGGDSLTFSRLVGIDPYEETTVGEMVIGRGAS